MKHATTGKPPRRGALLLVLLLLAGGLAAGRPQRPGGPIELPLSSEAEGRLQAAARLTARQQWELAVPLLQEVVEQEDNRLVAVGATYQPARRRATAMIAGLPPEAQRVYRLLYEPHARTLCREAVKRRSPRLLRQVVRRYLNTGPGVRAAGALGALLMDAGEYAAALRVLRATELLSLGPKQRAPLLARKLVCLGHLGRTEQAEAAVRAARAGGVEELKVGDRTWAPGRFAAAVFRAARRKHRRPALRPTPHFGDQLPDGTTLPLTMESPGADGGFPPGMPVAVKDTLFLKRGDGVVAVDLARPAVRWRAWGPGALRAAAYALVGRPAGVEPRPLFLPLESLQAWRQANQGLSTVSAGEGRAYAVHVDWGDVRIPDTPWEATPEEVDFRNVLRCYAGETGRLRWSAGGDDGDLAGYWFFTAPALDRGRAYVLGEREGRLWAVCLDADTGRPLWTTRIGAFRSRRDISRYVKEFYYADASPPAVARGVALFPTGQGVLCGLDAYSGEMLWVAPYERAERRMNHLGTPLVVPAGPWRVRRPCTVDGVFVIAPCDSRSVMAVRPLDGSFPWHRRHPRGEAVLGGPDGRICLQHAGLTCVHARTGRVVWEEDEVRPATGAGALGTDRLYVPTPAGLSVRGAATGEATGLLEWPCGRPPRGDLMLLEEALLAVEPGRLVFYQAPNAQTARRTR